MSLLGLLTRRLSVISVKTVSWNSVNHSICVPSRHIVTSSSLLAGHSKWQNIRHIKAAKDGAKARINSRTIQDMNVAIREGGSPDPKINDQLARVIERAEKQDVPKQTIQNALKRAREGKPRVTHFYDLRGPGNCALIVEAFTDSVQRTKSDLQSVNKKSGGRFSPDGNRFFFDAKGMLYLDAGTMNFEQAEELAIEAGAEEVEEFEEDGEKFFKLICAEDEMFMVKKLLEVKNVSIHRHGVEYVPTTFTTVSQESMDQLEQLLDKYEALDDVVRVYDNVEVEES